MNSFLIWLTVSVQLISEPVALWCYFFPHVYMCLHRSKGRQKPLDLSTFSKLINTLIMNPIEFFRTPNGFSKKQKKCAHLLSIWILNDNLRTIFCFNIIYFFPLLNDIWHNRSMHRHTASWQTHAHTLDEQIVWQIVWNFS